MKKYIYKIVLFLIGFCIALELVCVPFHPLKKIGMQYVDVINKTKKLSYEDDYSIEAIILGDSIPWAGISPLRMYAQDKITVYNCSTSGQRLIDSTAILKRALKLQSPKLVVLDVNCAFTPINSIRYYVERIFPIIRYHDYYGKNLWLESNADDWKGYNYTLDCTINVQKKYMIESVVNWPKLNKKYLDKIYSICQKNSISLVLMALPCPNSWNQTKHDLIQKWADKKSVEFLDFNSNSMVDIDYSKDFRDNGEHLNDNGATKCSYALGKYLKETYNLQGKINQEYERAIEAVGVYGQDGLQ